MRLENDVHVNHDYFFKILLLGTSRSGKSQLMSRFVDNTFVDSYSDTIGVTYNSKIINWPQQIGNSKRVKLQIWDTAGHEKFKQFISSFYRGSNIVLIIIRADQSHEAKKKQIKEYHAEIEKHCFNCHPLVMIVETQCDRLDDQLSNSAKEFRLLSDHDSDPIVQSGELYVALSAKTSANMEQFNAKLFQAFTILNQQEERREQSQKAALLRHFFNESKAVGRELEGWHKVKRTEYFQSWLPFFNWKTVSIITHLERINQQVTLNNIAKLNEKDVNTILNNLHSFLCQGLHIPNPNGPTHLPYKLGTWGGKNYTYVKRDLTHAITYTTITVTDHVWSMLHKIDNRHKLSNSLQGVLQEVYLDMINAALSHNNSRDPETQTFYAQTSLEFLEKEVANYFSPVPESPKDDLQCVNAAL